MWIETSNGELVNLDNFDYVFPQKEDDLSQWEYVLRTEKQVGGNGEEIGAYLSKRLCFGSEAHCRDQLGLIIEALRFQRKTLVTVANGDPKPEPQTEQEFPYISPEPCPRCNGAVLVGEDASVCQDCGHKTGYGLDTAAALAKTSGYFEDLATPNEDDEIPY